jgi:hypothetical protein
MQVKLILSWDIKQGRDQEYFEFVVREFAPGVTRLGLRTIEAWFTMYGSKPQVMMGAIAENLTQAKSVLASTEWQALYEKLSQYISNYQQKIVRLTPYFSV